MSDCPTCGVSFDCFDPATLYSLQSVTYPFVTVCPPGQVCDIGSDFHLICCQEDIHIVFPPGFSLEQKQQVIAGAVAECQRQAAFCVNDHPPPCPNPPCNLVLYWNRTQTCTANCSDGTPYNYTIGPGRWLGTTQLMADTFAYREACMLAKTHLICLSDLSGFHCADVEPELIITAKGTFLAVSPQADFWEVVSGTIPTGMTFEGGFRTDRRCIIDGIPTTAGEYTFRVRVTCWTVGSPGFGDYTEKSYTLTIGGISPATLPDASIDTPYLQNLSVSPTHDQETEVWTLVTSLPAGLELTSAGVITGTPTGPAESHNVTVSVTFTLGDEEVTCQKEYTLTVSSDIPIPFAYYECEEATSPRVNSVTPGTGDLELNTPNDPGNTSGKIDNGVLFSSAFSYYLATVNEPSFNYAQTGFMMTGWIKLAAINSDRLFITAFEADAGSDFWFLTFNYNPTSLFPIDNKLYVRYRRKGSSAELVSCDDVLPTANQWCFFVIWVDEATQEFGIRINDGAKFTAPLPDVTMVGTTGRVDINQQFNQSANYILDEVGLWKEVLSDAAQTALYAAGAATRPPFS